MPEDNQHQAPDFWAGIARAATGALIFEIPSLMTAEMWTLARVVKPWRVGIVFALLPFLILWLCAASGFRHSKTLADDVADAGAAIAVASAVALIFLTCFGVITTQTSMGDLAAIIVAQVLPGSIGAALARAQFGSEDVERHAKKAHGEWIGGMFSMMIGALVMMVPLSTADEIVVLAWQMGPIRLVALALITLSLMHVIVYTLKETDRDTHNDQGFFRLFFLRTLVGYALVGLVATYLLWTFGRLDDMAFSSALGPIIVLALPGGFGAAIARLLL